MNRWAARATTRAARQRIMNTFQHAICHLFVMNLNARCIHTLPSRQGQVRNRRWGAGERGSVRVAFRWQSRGPRRRRERTMGGGTGKRPLRELAGIGKSTIDFMWNAPANVHLRGGAWGSGWSGRLGKKIHCFLLICSHGAKGNAECNELIPPQQALEHGYTTMHGRDESGIQRNKCTTSQEMGFFLHISSTAGSDESQLEIECASRWVRATVHRNPGSRRLVVGDEDHDSVVHEARTPV